MRIEEFRGRFDVSRETCERLEIYEKLLRKWNPAINLVSAKTIEHMWQRHFTDSAQLYELGKQGEKWADLGSGGGFPGLVIAILAAEHCDPDITLVEADGRKAAFLRTVLREVDVPATVLAERIENAAPLQANIVSARALAPLPKLLALASRHLHPNGTALLPKGEGWRAEISDAQAGWSFDLSTVRSITDLQSVILVVKGIARA